MISNEERREVASRLRAIDPDDFSSYSEEHECVEKALGIWDDFDKFLWHVVADLIEPTPKSSDIGLTCDRAALVVLARNLDLLALMVSSHELTGAGQIAGTCQNIANGIREALGEVEE